MTRIKHHKLDLELGEKTKFSAESDSRSSEIIWVTFRAFLFECMAKWKKGKVELPKKQKKQAMWSARFQICNVTDL